MERFKSKVSEFNPGYLVMFLSSVFAQVGYYKEEAVEYNDDNISESKPIEELIEPVNEGVVSNVFNYFGYYSKTEIDRRRSLRLRGLDPEYEGLTWGKRTRRKRILPFFKDYHEDDEVFFNYHEENAMERFKSKVAKFNPGYIRKLFSAMFSQLGYYKEESLENIDNLVDETKSLEELMKPSHEGIISIVFGTLGYYSENEIKRRQSLRLKGLEPEFEGLTWGKRRRSRKAHDSGDYNDDQNEDDVFFDYHEENTVESFQSKIAEYNPGYLHRFISRVFSIIGYYKEESMANTIDINQETKSIEELMKSSNEWIVSTFFSYFGYYSQKEIRRRHSLRLQGLDPEYEGLTWGKVKRTRFLPSFLSTKEKDEYVFEYHEHEDGILQRWTDYFLHKIGYLHFEDIHEESYDDHEDDVSYVGEGAEDQEEEYNLNYVQIPQESFVNRQHQHEVFENSYSFEATEGYDDSSANITVTKDDNLCLGIILILAIPLLLLLSLAILDSNLLFQGFSSEDLKTTSSTLSQLYSSLWSIPKWCCSISIQMIFDGFNGLFIGLINLVSWIFGLFFNAFYVILYSFGSLKNATTFIKDEKIIITQDKINYDDLVKHILNDNSFKSALLTLQQKIPNEKSMKAEMNEIIQSRFENIMKTLEHDQVWKDKIDAMEVVTNENEHHKNTLKNLNDEHDQVISELKTTTSTLKDRLDENNNNVEAIKVLHEKILSLNQDVQHLDQLLKNCCKSNELQKEFIHKFFEAQKDQFITKDQFQAELSTIIQLIHENLIEKSKESIHELIDFKLTSKPNNLTVDSDALTKWDIEDMVKSALTVYGADKTGAFDFALETAGGSVVSTRCTQMYTDQMLSYSWLGMSIWLPLPVWGPTTNPRTAIQPGVMPGECWAFKGHEGYLVIKLAMPMKPTRFSMEHIPKSLSPNGKFSYKISRDAERGVYFLFTYRFLNYSKITQNFQNLFEIFRNQIIVK